ncbi:hypothetical protein FOA43_000098 [Brettanomyces nanus]|uniref:Uncharacterized protein n=1 Tax=Eeniella nana TaxID=13502 RepID=A0A875RVX1_EENNA|nr:uncharacterized protein FOA43_000098 [Brettanomyces nanus]QPG72796.1 hypothetical protein FOA43_000098 [Brettanomyces nanus]
MIGTKVNQKVMDGLLDLTGLRKSLNSGSQLKLVNSLNEQLQFLNELHSIQIPRDEEKNLRLSRLVDDASDEAALNFDQLLSNIKDSEPEFIKGEVEETWNPISFTEEHDEDYYIVKEGLIKKNKTKN